MRRRTLFMLLGSLLLLTAAAWADSQVRIVRLSYVEGDVQIDRGDSAGFTRAFINMPVIEGARVWARNDGRVEVELEDGSTARLAPDTILEFPQLRLHGDGRLTVMNLQEGEAYFNIKKHREDDLRITVVQQELIPEKSSHFRLTVDKQELSAAVFNGDVLLQRLNGNGEQIQIHKNESLTLSFADASRYYLARDIPEMAEDSWDHQRDEERNSVANRQTFPGYSSAYNYGVSDLDRYGTFIDVNNYGQLWQPYGVGYGWQPFQDGYWVWYPGQGYLWVSSYPWGWTPYRYGSWINVPGYGWCWRPGQTWRNWAPVPAVVNPPASFVPPRPPSTPGIAVVPVGRGGNVMDPDRFVRPGRGTRSSSSFVPGTSSTTSVTTVTTPTSVPVPINVQGTSSTSSVQQTTSPAVQTTTPIKPAAPAIAPAERPTRSDRNSEDRPKGAVTTERPSRPSTTTTHQSSPPPVQHFSPPAAPPAARESRSSRNPK